MRIPGVLATAAAAVLLLSSCAPSSTPDSRITSTPSPTVSAPAFLAVAQVEADTLPAGVAESNDIGATTTRYQGQWDGREVFLGLKNNASVCVIAGTSADTSAWAAECAPGDQVITWSTPDGGEVKYLPMTTSATPQGWTRLSDYVFAM